MSKEFLEKEVFSSNCEVAIHVPDLVAAELFYTEVLGFQLVEKDENGLELDTGVLRLFAQRDDDAILSYIPSLNVPNYEKARRHLENKGCRTIALTPPRQGVYFLDPFGFVFDIVERPYW